MTAFFKKEWVEVLRNKKLLLLIVISVFIGILNPFTAKITPFLLENFLPEALEMGEIEVTALDSWRQFYKNVPQFGLVFFLLLFSNHMTKEYDLNAMTLLLTKGLKRRQVLLSKFLVAHMLLAISLFTMFLITYIYTEIYWDQGMIKGYFLPLFALFILASFLYTVNLFGQVYFKSVIPAIVLTLLSVIVMYLLTFFEDVYNPLYLVIHALDLVQGNLNLLDLLKPLFLTITLTFVIFLSSLKKFNHQAL